MPLGRYIPVTSYDDCTGRVPLTHAAAAIDTCVKDEMYFLGHNPGVFTPALDLRVGDEVDYIESNGAQHHFVVDSIFVAVPPLRPPRPDYISAQMQTCIDAQSDLIVNLRGY